MNKRSSSWRGKLGLGWIFAVAISSFAALMTCGCGEKITLPLPIGLFSSNQYTIDVYWPAPGIKQVEMFQGNLFVLTSDSLTKRDQAFNFQVSVAGMSNPTSMCIENSAELIFVWEQNAQTVSWFEADSLQAVGQTFLPEVQTAADMVTTYSGIDEVPEGEFFLYLSDPISGVVHRYMFNQFSGLSPFGILCHNVGEGTRSVHIPGAMAIDHEGQLVICDVDTNRNWVIRFDSSPDYTDLAVPPATDDPWRGVSVMFYDQECGLPVAADYVLGNAQECGETEWVGGTSRERGEMNMPGGIAVDGSGRIFVADTGNKRIQVFADGMDPLTFGGPEANPGITSIVTVDYRTGSGDGGLLYGGYMYGVCEELQQVQRFVSAPLKDYLYEPPPPPDLP